LGPCEDACTRVDKETLVNLLAILPLAIVMIAGPQIISATLIATSQDARRNSLAFLAGVAVAITVGTMVVYWAASLAESSTGPARQGTVGTVIDWLIIALLVILMVRVFARRRNTAPPKWMAGCRPPMRDSRSGSGCCCFWSCPPTSSP
jgi:small neutral amino acid transporter SnatA (MarC family)